MTQTLRTQVTAAVAAVVLVSFFVLRTSQAAFTASTSSGNNTFSAGTVTLTNDAPSGATWSPAGVMGPGDAVSGCIEVTYTGSLTPNNPVTMSVSNDNAGMAGSMNVTVDVAADCSTAGDGVAEISGTLVSVAGATGWNASPTDSVRGFWITVEMDPAIDDSHEGQSVVGTFTWTVVDDG